MPQMSKRRTATIALVASAAGFGAGAWLLLGPLWTIAGVVAGPVIFLVGYSVVVGTFDPQPVTLLSRGRPEEAFRKTRQDERSIRQLARIWPGQFREALAHYMSVQAHALREVHQYAQALRSADESVAIYQALAAEKPAKYSPRLAHAIDTRSRVLAGLERQAEAIGAIETAIRMFRNLAITEPGEYLPVLAEALTCMAEWLADIGDDAQALAVAHEATGIYWHRLPGPDLSDYAARAALLEGRLLCQSDRYHEAVRPLARGWTLAAGRQLHALSTAIPALKKTCNADPEDFVAIWRAETSLEPPPWLNITR